MRRPWLQRQWDRLIDAAVVFFTAHVAGPIALGLVLLLASTTIGTFVFCLAMLWLLYGQIKKDTRVPDLNRLKSLWEYARQSSLLSPDRSIPAHH